MKDSHDPGPVRNRFEAHLREQSPPGYRLYISIKKLAISKGTDPVREFRDYISSGAPDKGGRPSLSPQAAREKAMSFWLKCVGKRLVESELNDVEFLRAAMAERKIDLDEIVDMCDGDLKKAADVIRAFHLEKLDGVDFSTVYMVVDKLLRSRTEQKWKNAGEGEADKEAERRERPVPPAPRHFYFDEIPEDVLAEMIRNVDGFELLKKIGIEKYQREFELDPEAAEKALEEGIASCEGPAKKGMLAKVRDYYRELMTLEIPGIVATTIDSATGLEVRFPAVHQKVGARFIATKRRALIADEMGIGKTAQAVIAKNLIDRQEGRKTTSVVVVPNNMLRGWAAEIAKWNTEKKSVVTISSGDKAGALERVARERPDFVLVSYDMVFRKHNGGTVGSELAKVCDYLILDEIHNAKDARNWRGRQVMELSRASRYVAMLTGTPVPNRVSDLGVVATILWNHEFEPDEFNRRYERQPQVVREYILPFMLRRSKKGTFGETKCTRHIVTVPMTRAQQKAHERAALNAGRRKSLDLLFELRKCALDPRLVGIDEESPKYARLAELLVDHHDGRPAVVFSSELKEGVLDKLESGLSGYGFRVARIDGDQERSGSRRMRILEDFVRGEYDVIVATLKTLGEGVNQLSVASRGYFIDVPFTEARLAQGITRLDRKGQKNPVDIYILVSENSIDSLLLRLIEQKRILGQLLIDGMELTPSEKQIIESAEKLVESGGDVLRNLYRFFGTTTNRRSEEVCRLLQDEAIGRFVAENYWENFEGSFYGNTMNLIVRVIEGLEKGGKRFDNALDIASGPCCLARAWGRQVTSLDANKAALDYGLAKLGDKAGEAVHASFTAMPLPDSKFDLAVFSLGLLHSAPDEREAILREMNRVLSVGGVAIITTPSGDERYEKLSKALPMLGFRALPQITGTALGVEKKEFECMIISAVKVGEPQAGGLPVGLFDFHGDRMENESWEAAVPKKIKRRVCEEFEIDDISAQDAGEQSAGEIPAGQVPAALPPLMGDEVAAADAADMVPEMEMSAPIPEACGEKAGDVAREEESAENPVFAGGDPIEFLKRKYGNDIKRIVQVAPDEELAALGVEKSVNSRTRMYCLRRIDGDMRADHDDFVKKAGRGRGGGKGGSGRLAI